MRIYILSSLLISKPPFLKFNLFFSCSLAEFEENLEKIIPNWEALITSNGNKILFHNFKETNYIQFIEEEAKFIVTYKVVSKFRLIIKLFLITRNYSNSIMKK